MSIRPWLCLIAALSAGCALPHAELRGDGAGMDATRDAIAPIDCDAGTVQCGAQCVSIQTDVEHCGACDNRCARANAVTRCDRSRCAIDRCVDGFADCDGDPSNGCEASLGSAEHCGACGVRCTGATPACDATTRTCATGCPAGQQMCGGRCVDTQADNNHCGGCGITCAGANGTTACERGTCVVRSCDPGFGDCNGLGADGCESPLGSSAHCARCGDACAGATPVCGGVAVGCTSGCTSPAVRCGMDCVDLQSSPAHCGACNRPCAAANAITSRCESARCRAVSCSFGFGDCDGDPFNGCETNTITDAQHCGACGSRCTAANGTGRCVGGICTVGACNPGFADCDRIAANGCEVDTRTSLNHCGACNATCAPSNAAPTCVAGACGFSSCVVGFGDCDRVQRNGCEVDTRSANNHCGACGVDCARANASTACVSSMCQFIACDAGFGDCNANRMDGCEANLQTNVNHCGLCGKGCVVRPNAAIFCAAATCGFTCNAGFGDCDRIADNGCESPFNTVANCGACGRMCAPANATGTCPSRACQIASCDAGFANCNGMVGDGCEVTLGTDAHCSRCGDRCPMGQSCRGGSCR